MLRGERAYCSENKYVASTITVCIIPGLIPCPADVLSTYHRWAQTGRAAVLCLCRDLPLNILPCDRGRCLTP